MKRGEAMVASVGIGVERREHTVKAASALLATRKKGIYMQHPPFFPIKFLFMHIFLLSVAGGRVRKARPPRP